MTPTARPTGRTRDAVEHACDRLVADAGGHVVQFRRPRGERDTSSQDLGVPTRRYRVLGTVFWWEVKAEKGRLTEFQANFLLAEHQHGEMCGAGDEEALRDVIRALQTNPDRATIAAWEHAKKVADRGIVLARDMVP